MFEVPVLLVLIVVVALIFDFTNGAHDCANAIATVVSTKVLSPRVAVVMAASLNFIGAFLGTKVATTLGAGIVNTDMVANCQPLVLAALLGAIAWNLITWYFGIPSSSSHALIGGLMGAAVAYAGFSTLNGASIAEKILLPLILSPLAGFGMGFLTMFLRPGQPQQAHPRLHQAANRFRRLHGDEPRPQRCPEDHGRDHARPLHL